MSNVPETRISACNEAPVRPERDYILYWMIAARRPQFNFGLQRAIELAVLHGKGLVVFEPLRCDYRWASDRIHQFIIDGMQSNARAFAEKTVLYFPYVEPNRGAGKGLLQALAKRAVCIVTDEFPCFFLPHMVEMAGANLDVCLEQVDSIGLYPLHAADREFTVAHSFRRHLQKELPPHLGQMPLPDPMSGVALPNVALTPEVLEQWDSVDIAEGLASLPIDHDVAPGAFTGGHEAGRENARRFVNEKLSAYDVDRNHPDEDVASGLSPWLHFGHVSTHELFSLVAEHEDWTPAKLAEKPNGKRNGWWGVSEPAEAFLDELITWRELGYQWCHRHPEDYDCFDSLPDFARTTLTRHAADKRPYVYTLQQFEDAETDDEVWNAAQRQLVIEGRIHNYLRMLWGKKILHWTESPQQALEFMIHLNNKYALDGRDPNSYSGIMWCLGRFDRAWGPERAVFGKVRYMTSASTRRKCHMEDYLSRFGPDAIS